MNPRGRTGFLYTFEGQQMTLTEIRAIVPRFTTDTIRRHIEAGRTTRRAMLSFDATAAMRKGASRRVACDIAARGGRW